jgi:polysaccharide export outer membrane protein
MTARFGALVALPLMMLLAGGCATSPPPSADVPAQTAPAVGSAPLADDGASLKVSRLDELMQSRHNQVEDFPIGPGDVVAISVPGLPDFDNSHGGGQGGAAAEGGGTTGTEAGGATLDNWTVRVGSQGEINLPLLGRIHVAGLTEEQLREELKTRLLKYMYDPQVELFVKSYNSREVAVSGEVHAPGLYTISEPNETIRDLIVRAGGTNDSAASRIILTPAPAKGHEQRAGMEPVSDSPTDSGIPSSNDTNPLSVGGVSGSGLNNTYIIDLSKGQSNQRYLNIQVRPGDTIYVPRAGAVTVIGWVYSPKTIDIRPGLTVLNAVSEAGGPLFAGDSSRVKVLRQAPGEETKTLMVNLDDIKNARTPDLLVQANDVIDVPYSALKIPGYALYYGVQGFVQMAPAALLFSGGL